MDYFMLQQYTHLVEFLGKALGPDYEICLYDLSGPNKSIVSISNGHVTGRDVGAPLTNTMMQLIAEGDYENGNYHLHYSGIYSGKHCLRSSILYLKDDSGSLVGLLCINFDDSRYQEMSNRIMSLCHPDYFFTSNISFSSSNLETTFSSNNETNNPDAPLLSNISEEMIDKIIKEKGIPLDKLTSDGKKEIVEILNKKGFFNVKGAVQLIADKLNCSLSTIYRYLSKTK